MSGVESPGQCLAIISATPTPYFTHGFERLAAELRLARIELYYTHARTLWPEASPSVLDVRLQRKVETDWDPSWRARRQEWVLGRQIIDDLHHRRPAMVLLIGYRDPARLRVMRWCRRNKIPVFVWSDINALGQHSQGIRAFVKSQYLRWIDRQIAAWLICGSAGRQYLERFGINGRRLFVSPCEPAYEQIDAVSREQVAQAQTQFGLDPARRRIVCSGRFVESKRFDLAIDAFAAVAGQRDEWDLLILGDGPLNNALRARVPSGLANRVTFAGFVPDPATVWALYKSCDVLLHVPDHEAWGLVVNEAAACGMALVCSDVVGAAVELVRDGFNGRIVPRNDLAATTAALLDVTDPERLTVYRGNSRTMLDAWRTNADPVDGFRRALAFAGLSG